MIDVFIYLSRFELISMQIQCKFITILLLLFGWSNNISAQFGFSHEIGAIAGPVAFQSDYGIRGDISTNMGNVGYGIGIVHYLNFSYRADCNCYTPETYFNDHFKLRSELSYNKTDLKHYGKWVEPGRTGVLADQLRAMRGSTAVTNVGMQLEFFPLSIREFTATKGSFAPFISLGGQFSFYNPRAWSKLGPINIPATTPDKYLGGITNQGGTTWSIVSSLGSRYRLNDVSDLMVDLRWQYYYSNWVDGLSPEVPENKANDWNVWLNFGYIYYLD